MQATYVGQSATTPGGVAENTLPGGRAGNGRVRRQAAVLKSRNCNGNGANDRSLVEALVNSRVFQDYERAFSEATGLPVALRPVESWQLPHHGKRNEGPFCALISQKSRACASCLSVQEKLSNLAAEQANTIGCPNGLSDTAVPVRLGDRLIGFLQTGQVFRKKPTETQFDRVARQVATWGIDVDREKLHKAYFSTQVVPLKHHEAVVKLLSIFAQHLSMLSNQVVVQQENAEPPVILRAKEYIQELTFGSRGPRLQHKHVLFLQDVQEDHRH
jgi:ligand-binding sensor protein